MAFYQTLMKLGTKYLNPARTFKMTFNLSPMYRRSTARIQSISKDLLHIKVKLPINYKNKNYMGTIFGGSMFSAVDPIPMVQLIALLGSDYVIWDKSANIRFKKPANVDLYADFEYSKEELEEIKQKIIDNKETEIVKKTLLTNKEKSVVFCEVDKNIYVADKAFFKLKQEQRKKK